MKQQIHRYKCLIILVLLISCNHYQPIYFNDRINISNKQGKRHEITDYSDNADIISVIEENKGLNVENSELRRFLNENDKGYPVSSKKEYDLVFKRYFVKVISFSPVAMINNKGVECALEKRYKEAKTLFEEAVKEEKNFSPAYNNLGIVYEMLCNEENAFSMYSKACVIDADNQYYRKNFLYFRNIDQCE